MPHPAARRIRGILFDKDGTLIDFHAMWAGWADAIGHRLEAATRRPVAGDVFAAIGYDPVAARARTGSPLAIATMAELREVIAAVVRRWCPSVAAARGAVEEAWFEPDPVTTAVPTTDLTALFASLRASGRRIAIATTDDRAPTEATLRALGLRSEVSAIACGDDGVGVKPDPAMVLALCRSTGVEPGRGAVFGDTPADLTMGRAAGLRLVAGVLTGVGTRGELEPLADVILGSVGELLEG